MSPAVERQEWVATDDEASSSHARIMLERTLRTFSTTSAGGAESYGRIVEMMAALLSRTKSSEDSRVLGAESYQLDVPVAGKRKLYPGSLEEGRVGRIGLREEEEDALVAVCARTVQCKEASQLVALWQLCARSLQQRLAGGSRIYATGSKSGMGA